MKIIFTFAIFIIFLPLIAQPKKGNEIFWNNLKKHCGKSYEGTLADTSFNDALTGKRLVMHVRACYSNTIKIPFFVGDDRSRTWVLTYAKERILLKHDHRHKDGSPDSVTQYGGRTNNTGLPTIQAFAADQETADLIPAASNNVWWITLDETSFTYNLRRIGTTRLFSVKFDLTKPVESPAAPWGWKD